MRDSLKINNEIKIIGLYAIVFVLLIIALNQFFITGLLDSHNFLYGDAGHYYWIKNNGYNGFRTAFFPLFPMVWKGLSVGITGIVFFNSILFLISFYFLIRTLETSTLETILYLSIPSFIFFYLPFTESIFFASSTLLLFGLKNKKIHFVVTGLLLCTLSRPAFIIFIPALIITELLSEKINKQLVLSLSLYLAVAVTGLLMVGFIQYYYTGQWFEFFNAQKGWGNGLQMPKFPLTSWAGGLIVRLDGAAMLFGTVAGIILILYIFKAKLLRHVFMPKEVIFSLSYLAGITLFVFIFRGGSLFSLNRFVFATPFIVIAANYYFKQKIIFNKKQLLFGFIILFSFWLSFGSYLHIQTLLKYFLLSIYLFLVMFTKSDNRMIDKISMLLLISVNLIFQVVFYVRFLSGGWIG